MDEVDAVALRSATPVDSQFCYELHAAVTRPCLVEAVGSTEGASQRAYHVGHFDPSRTQIITADGLDVGSLVVERRQSEIYLAHIEIHPHHQGQNIGSRIIRALLKEAAELGHYVVLDVLIINLGARSLYRRLGFHEVTPTSNNKIRMKADP